MSFISNLRMSAARVIAPSNSTTADSSSIRRGDSTWAAFIDGAAGGGVSEKSALGVSTVYACTQVVSGAIASLPMHIYKREADGDKIRDYNHDYWWILNEEFSPRWTAAAGWQFLVASKVLHGNGYAEILRNRAGRMVGLAPLHPDRVRPIAAPDGSHLVYEIAPDMTIEKPEKSVSKTRTLHQDDVIHVAGLGFDGLRGISPLGHWLRNPTKISVEAQRFAESFFENNSRPDFSLETDANLTDEQFAALQEMLNDYRGAKNTGKPIILEGGLKINPITMPLKDMQLLETRKFQVEEICRVYGVPPFMVGHTEKTTSWGSGVSEMGQGFVRFTLRDHLNAFQAELNRKIFRRSRFLAEFDTRELERANTKELFESLRIALGRAGERPFMTMEEVREFISLPRSADLPEPLAAGPVEPSQPEPAVEPGTEIPDDGDTDAQS